MSVLAVRSVDYRRFLSVLSVSICFKYKRNRKNKVTSGAVEEKEASNIGVQGSNPGRDYPVCEIFRMAKTDNSYVKVPTKTDQNDKKNVRALVGFGEVKATKTDDFLCLNAKNFSTRGVRPQNLSDSWRPIFPNFCLYLVFCGKIDVAGDD